MSYFRSCDPLMDFDRYDREQERQRERLPKCEDCGKRIDDDHYFEIDGEILCEDCVIRRYRKNTEDYIE